MGKIERASLVGGILISLGGTAMMAYAPALFPQGGQFGFWAGLAGLVIGAGLVIWALLHRRAEEARVTNGDDWSIKTGDVSGIGHRIGHEFHGPQQRQITPKLRDEMLRELPRNEPIRVMCPMGDAEAVQFANEIHAFIKAEGFQLADPNGVTMAVWGEPVRGLDARRTETGVEVIVGSQ